MIDNKVADFQIWDNALTDDQLLKVKKNKKRKNAKKNICYWIQTTLRGFPLWLYAR